MLERLAIEDFDYIKSSEVLHHVPSAQVLWADYDRLCAGPGEGRRAKREIVGMEKRVVDRWLTSSVGVLSRRQCDANPVNDKVETTARTCVGHRPLRYGRSAIVETRGPLSDLWPLLDVKGCGVIDAVLPEVSYHGTGVVGMGRAFRELILAKFIETLLRRLNNKVRPVRILALLSLGVDINLVDRRDIACVLIREPHLRPPHNYEIPERRSREMKVKVALEALFMSFGFSSAWKFMEIAYENGQYTNTLDGGGQHPYLGPTHMKAILEHLADGNYYEFGLANIQLCRATCVSPLAAELIDLEHFFFRERFDMDVWFPAHNQPMNWGYLCGVRDPRFVQPNADLLERTRPMHAALGGDLPTQEAAFAHGVSYEKKLRAGANPSEITRQFQSLLSDIERSVQHELFDDPIEIIGQRVRPRELDRWALKWAEELMSDSCPAFLCGEDVSVGTSG